MLPPQQVFNKPALSPDDLIALMIRRGLAVPDVQAAKGELAAIGYYRLSAYMLPFQMGAGGVDRHDFSPGVDFEAVLDLYAFDRSLRVLTFAATERVEIAVRAAISDQMSRSAGPHWFLDPGNFDPNTDHRRFLARLGDDIGHRQADAHKRTVAIRHYYSTYRAPPFPPSWMVLEALSFGSVSQIYRMLKPADKKIIARRFGLDDRVLQSWTHAISYTRNLCAHHARLWNRVFTIKPIIARAHTAALTPNSTFHAQAASVQVLLRVIPAGPDWPDQLEALFAAHPNIAPADLGFAPGWRQRGPWR